jgi:hypothetical protein
MGTAPFSKCYYRLTPARIGMLRFLLEGYDGLITLRTLDPRGGLVECAFPPTRQTEAQELLTALAAELGLQAETAPPDPVKTCTDPG